MKNLAQIVGVTMIGGTLLFGAPASAEDNTAPPSPVAPGQTAAQPSQDPPARVGRLAYIEGQTLQFGAGKDDWADAQLNFPVTSNTAFATGPKGRAELELGTATARLDFGTELDVVTLDAANTALRLPQGSAAVDVPAPADGAAPIATLVTTPRGDVTLSAPGHYFLTAGTTDQPTTVTVVDGQAQIADAANATFTVVAGQTGTLTGDSNHPSFGVAQPQPGPFVAWVQQRDTTAAAVPPPPPEVSPQMTGVDVLSAYGDWRAEKKYGSVWFPRDVKADWKPYRDGHWVDIQPWGWTWVDNEPWGFAPFHYGRWIRIHGRWAWAPGSHRARRHVARTLPTVPAETAPTQPEPTQAQGEPVTLPPQPDLDTPVYAPALVAFGNVGDTATPGNPASSDPSVAWYPLGWNEPYVPSYPVSRDYLEEVNQPVVDPPRLDEIANDYSQISDPNANFDPYERFRIGANRNDVIAIPRSDFQNARPVPQSLVVINVTLVKPEPKPANVKTVPVRPKTILVIAQPPQPKILPRTNRVQIPKQLLTPKQPNNGIATNPPHGGTPIAGPRPTLPSNAANTPGKSAVQPVVAHPEKKPETKPIPKPLTQPAVAHPEKKPETKPVPKPLAQPVVAHPEKKPETNPIPKPPTQPAVAHPEKKPETKPIPKPPVQVTPTVAHPEKKPETKPRTPPVTSTAVHPEPKRETKPTPALKPVLAHPERKPETKPAVNPPVKTTVVHPEAKPAPKKPEPRPVAPTVVHPEAKMAPKPTVITPAKPAVVHPEAKPEPKREPKPAVVPPGNTPKHPEPKHEVKASPSNAPNKTEAKPKPAPDGQH